MGSSKQKGHISNMPLRRDCSPKKQRTILSSITGHYQAISTLQLNENHDDDESDCINADEINDDDQDSHSSIDGDPEDNDEKDSQNSNNINNNIIHNKNAIRLYRIAV